jgi:hypothetical protein
MNKKCPQCNLINFSEAETCRRCEFDLKNINVVQTMVKNVQSSIFSKILRRGIVCFAVCLFCILGFYLSLIGTSSPLAPDEGLKVNKAISILEEKGFSKEVFLLRYLTRFRSNDNWLNASTRDENAYAATNFPFEIITIYPEFSTVPQDDIERAMVLLHEAQHLQGADEKTAYEYVWRNRKTLGWTEEMHGDSKVFRNIKKQTKEFAPNLFQCDWNIESDCTK